MPSKFQAKINQHFHDELIQTLAHQTGLPPEKLRASIRFSILATVYQMKFRLDQPKSMLVTYRMAKVAAGAEITRHLISLYNKQGHYQGILNMTSVLHNGDFSKIEKMLEDQFGLTNDISNRIIIMSTCATISILGESNISAYTSGNSDAKCKALVAPVEVPITITFLPNCFPIA